MSIRQIHAPLNSGIDRNEIRAGPGVAVEMAAALQKGEEAAEKVAAVDDPRAPSILST